MKIYLCARYSRWPEMAECARQLEQIGHEVTSRWIRGGHQADDDLRTRRVVKLATEDFEDIKAADCLIAFAEPSRVSSSSRGGRHWEFGAAYALGKRCVAISHIENLFFRMPGVETATLSPACVP